MKSERINYTITENGNYVAHSVNMPLIVQARTFEEMKRMTRELAKHFSEHLESIIADDLFEYVEETKLDADSSNADGNKNPILPFAQPKETFTEYGRRLLDADSEKEDELWEEFQNDFMNELTWTEMKSKYRITRKEQQ